MDLTIASRVPQSAGAHTRFSRHFKKSIAKKLFTIKLLIVFLITGYIHANAEGHAQIFLVANNLPLQKALIKIQKQSGFDFFYSYEIVQNAGTVSVALKNVSLEEAVRECLNGKELAFQIIGKTVVIRKKAEETKAADLPVVAFKMLTGKVTNEQGEALQGVSVIVKGTQKGTATDANGMFSIDVKKGDVIQFTIVGYASKEIKVNDQSNLPISLVHEASGLNDVVVVAYGTQKKTSVTASVASIKGEDIAGQPVANLSNSIGGRVAGIIFTQGSGEPGYDGSNILIRGISTTGSTSPLVIVDGVPRNFTQLDPNSIASISILKDAAAVAPYGMGGANGVILITTKKGKTGTPSLTGDVRSVLPMNHALLFGINQQKLQAYKY